MMSTNNITRFVVNKLYSLTKISVRKYTPRRALMYVPGDDIKKVNKALTLKVDCVALDCEDGVAINKKEQARITIQEVLQMGEFKSKRCDFGVRVNSVESGLCHEDLVSCLSGKNIPNTILLPKVESNEHLYWFEDEISHIISPSDENRINLIIYIESAIAFVNLVDICKCAKQLSKRFNFEPVALVFGSDDFCANLAATRTEDSMEILYARQKLVLVAKAFDLQAIDMVYIKYKDLEGLEVQCKEGMRMGYTGKQVIHPGQVPIVQEAFLPTNSQQEWAHGLLKSFEEHQKSGKVLTSGTSFMPLSHIFMKGNNTINMISWQCCIAIWRRLQYLYVPKPNSHKWRLITKRFYVLWDTTNCISAISGKYVRVKKNYNTGFKNFNYKIIFSVGLMAYVDTGGLFTTIDVVNIRNSDDAVFRASHGFSHKIEYNVSIFTLHNAKQIFNYKLPRARKIVECRFGMLVSKSICLKGHCLVSSTQLKLL